MSFVHLHTHSEYSLLDGANRIPDLVTHVKKLGMDSLAVTDHGNMHAAWSFYEHAKAQKIRPILGFEAYLAFGPRTAREKPPGAPAPYSHLVLLAKNRTGYRNLIRLTSIGFVEGFYRRPRIDREVLAAHSEGIVCLAACLSGEVALHLRQGRFEEARRSAEWFSQTFGPAGFWLEIQQHGLPEERLVTEGMLRLGQELGIGVVATNDAHYLKREDAESHDVLLAIGTGSDLDDPKRFRFTGQESYVKSEAEMQALFPDRPDTLANTGVVAGLCEFDFEKRYFLPEFPRPAEYPSDEALLNHLATTGAERRYGLPWPDVVRDRLAYELGVINTAGYAGYFLIVQDFIAAARERGIPVGPGRGSVAGSLVAYALGITDVDPLKFDLLFERFLNPERVSMPDIDVDFCFERRGEVIEYVRERYGRTSVGQIVTFGTMKARAAVKDVARVLRIPPGEADRITKLIPSGPAYSLTVQEAAKKVDELRDLIRDNPSYERLVKLSSRIEGISRHMSVHAAGVVIAPGPLSEYVPVCTAPTRGAGAAAEGESIITQYEMGALEKVGMLKMDLLGLKTLTVIHDAVNMIGERHGTRPDMETLTFDDPKVYELLRQGRTAGVFQFESPLATDTLRAMRCDRFDDLVASNALLRPGPLDAGMHIVFIRRKLGQEKVTYPHPALREVLEPTYGVITYQEQVMRIANVLAGFSLAEADVLRKAVGKKDQDLANQEVAKFVERAVALGHPRSMVEELGRQIVTFGRYGFNKSHSVAYSILSYQTAWLKAHYPAEFMAALLSSEIGNTDKVVQYINEARELELEILPPDVNESGFKFTVIGERRIRFGLGAVRNVGEGAIASIIGGRHKAPYGTLGELVERIDLRLCNKRVLESLVAAGACDSLGGHRKQLIEVLEPALAEAQLRNQEREAGQGSLFGEGGNDGEDGKEGVNASSRPDLPIIPDIPAWTEAERLAKEKEVLGFFISGHPLERYREEVELFGSRTTATLSEWGEQQVSVAAVVTGVKRQISKKTGKEYARLVLEDFHGTAEAIVFPDAWAKLNQTILPDAALLLTGGYSDRDRGEDQAPFIVEAARDLADLKASGAVALSLRWRSPSGLQPSALQAVAALCSAHPGPTPLYIEWSDGNGEAVRLRSRRVRVAAEDDLVRALRELLGSDSVHYVKAG